MDAPLYLPAMAWEQPLRRPQTLSASRSSMADFLADAEGRAILKSEVRGLDTLVAIPQLKPHLSNLSPLSMSQLGGFVSADSVQRIQEKLDARQTRNSGQ